MKKLVFSLLMIAGLSLGASAQEKGPEHNPQQRLEKMTKHLTEELNLTAEQQEKLKVVLEDRQRLRQEDHARHKEEREQMKAKLKEFLTAEQMEKLEKIHRERKPHHKRRALEEKDKME